MPVRLGQTSVGPPGGTRDPARTGRGARVRGAGGPGKNRPGRVIESRALMLLASWTALASAACSEPVNPLLGEWISLAGQVPELGYIFEDGGRMKWILDLEEGPDTLVVGFRSNEHAIPAELDVGPWSSGPLTGRTMTGIFEMQGPDRFRVDFEPSDPDGQILERPSGFSDQTMHFVRKLN